MLKEALAYNRNEGDTNNIRIDREENSISLFIPSTNNNLEYISEYFYSINEHFGDSNILIHNTRGAWFAKDTKKITTECAVIIEVVLNKITEADLNYMTSLGLKVKEEMKQELVCLV